MIEKFYHKDVLLSIIIRAGFEKAGIEFFTPDNFSQQLAYMRRPKDYIIPPHVHNIVNREILFTQEVLIVRKGKIRVDLYDDDKNYLESCIIMAGDVILLAFGGHGFEMLEESEIIEVKQGPFVGELDKVRFEQVEKEKIKIKNENE